jgi:iron complex outermembrane receptor protein
MGSFSQRKHMRRLSTGFWFAALAIGITSACWAGDLTRVAHVDLPADSLGASLRLLAKEADVQISFPPDDVVGLQAPLLHGDYSVRDAVSLLLKGTPLQAIENGSDSISVRRPIVTPKPRQKTAASADPPAASESAPNTESTSLAEIVVTATKREERLENVPISIAALSAQRMEASGIKSINEIAAQTPGVEFDNVSNFGSATLTNISIRGINSTIGTSTTGVYIDDTPIQSRTTSSSAFGSPFPVTFDLNRVEVDRGPQGTLFGAGAEGGTVRFIMNEPSLNQFSGLTRAEVGFTDGGDPSYEAGAAFGGPIVPDTLGFRVAAWYREDGGYVDRIDPFTGATVDSNANYATTQYLRFALGIKASDSVLVTPSFSYQSTYNHDSGTFFDSLSNLSQGDLRNAYLVAQPARDTFYLESIKVAAGLPFADFASVTSYFHRWATTVTDATEGLGALLLPGPAGWGNPMGPAYPVSYADTSTTPATRSQQAISQELRLASTDSAAPLVWVAGLFYTRARQNDYAQYVSPILSGTSLLYSVDNAPVDTQVAAFGQLDWRIVEPLRLSLGLRASHTTAQASIVSEGLLSSGAPPLLNGSTSENPVTPKVGLSYQATENNLVYASVAKGYRIGGLNTPVPSFCSTPAPSSYASDSVWSYELGTKDVLFGGRLQIDASAFHIKWNNIQQSVLIASCGQSYFTNTGTADSNGFDLATQARIADHWTLGFEAGYTDAHYTTTVSSGGFAIVDSGSAIGGLPQVVSPWALTGSTEYSYHATANVAVTFRAEDVFHSRNPGPFTSENPAALSYDPNLRPNPSTNQLNFRVTANYSNLDVALFINNALNSQPNLLLTQDTPTSNLYYGTTFRPRTVGLSGTWRF